MQDWCTWDDDYNMNIVQKIRTDLVKLATSDTKDYTSVLIQGSGTYSVESAIGSLIPATGTLLVLSNGAYGKRIAEIAKILKINTIEYEEEEDRVHDIGKFNALLNDVPSVTHVAMVHCETTTGILNPVSDIAALCRKKGKIFILDAMSSFGGIPMDISVMNIDVLISSANKCIQGVPGFGFVILKKDIICNCSGIARSLSLDLYHQWLTMENSNGKWRFTSPTHVVRAFMQALKELEEEGGIEKRHKRYCENQRTLVQGMNQAGFKTFIADKWQSPVITSFLYPRNRNFNFSTFYACLKNKGFVIYPGKISSFNTFRIGTIGEVYPEDILRLTETVREVAY